jgi:hypothetical protein
MVGHKSESPAATGLNATYRNTRKQILQPAQNLRKRFVTNGDATTSLARLDHFGTGKTGITGKAFIHAGLSLPGSENRTGKTGKNRAAMFPPCRRPTAPKP